MKGAAKPKLLSGGNPQIPKGDGDAPRAELHRSHAGLETQRRTEPRRTYSPHRTRSAKGGEVELALLWH